MRKFESLDYNNRLCSAKHSNPAFYKFMLENFESSSTALFIQLPHIYGLLLKDNEWETVMRLRCFLWPQQLVNGLICKCGNSVSLTHLLNCNSLISFRTSLHDAVYKEMHCMAKSFGIESFPEPVLRSLDKVAFTLKNRGDLIMVEQYSTFIGCSHC
ncbi:hypothetical protein RCL1_006113 [Eukaryota sp. TZLM3-RCL]